MSTKGYMAWAIMLVVTVVYCMTGRDASAWIAAMFVILALSKKESK